MSNDQPCQIDCRVKSCRYYKSGGHCDNVSPAITLNKNGVFVCWSQDDLLNTEETANSDLGAVSSSAIRPPLGLIPKKIHDERVKVERFYEVCGAIARYYDAGLKINIEWIEEYNGLVECGSKDYA